jgi:hypothetical protein
MIQALVLAMKAKLQDFKRISYNLHHKLPIHQAFY